MLLRPYAEGPASMAEMSTAASTREPLEEPPKLVRAPVSGVLANHPKLLSILLGNMGNQWFQGHPILRNQQMGMPYA